LMGKCFFRFSTSRRAPMGETRIPDSTPTEIGHFVGPAR